MKGRDLFHPSVFFVKYFEISLKFVKGLVRPKYNILRLSFENIFFHGPVVKAARQKTWKRGSSPHINILQFQIKFSRCKALCS